MENCRLTAKDVKWLLQQKKNEKKQWFWFDGGTEQEQHSTLLSLWMDEYHISIYLVLHKTLLIISISFCCLHVFSSFSHTHTLFSLSFFCFFDMCALTLCLTLTVLVFASPSAKCAYHRFVPSLGFSIFCYVWW